MADVNTVTVQKVCALLRKAGVTISPPGSSYDGYQVQKWGDKAVRVAYFGGGYATDEQTKTFLIEAKAIVEKAGIAVSYRKGVDHIGGPYLICTGIKEV